MFYTQMFGLLWEKKIKKMKKIKNFNGFTIDNDLVSKADKMMQLFFIVFLLIDLKK